MLCRKFKQITLKPAPNNVTIHSIIPARQFSKKCINILTCARLHCASFSTMSSSLRLRNILKDLVVSRLFSAWTRSYIVSSVVKRCRKERTVRDAIQCFRQSILKPKRTLIFTVTAAYKSHDEKPGKPGSCSKNITDEELQELVSEFEGVEELAQATLYCTGCAKRVIIDNEHPGVRYCTCTNAEPPQPSYDGWEPYMEAEDVIIWRKEYKKGKGLYAYKVYGRYKEIRAQDFAAIQVDGAYRRVWDTAVAALSVVEKHANGVHDQIVLHWEVLWPRLFANRDYVYVRRHKEFDVKSRCLTHKDGIFNETPCQDAPIEITEPPNVHSNAKRKSLEQEKKLKSTLKSKTENSQDDKAYIIVSRSCVHPQVPETKNAIRVTEYWSHMVVKTLEGPGKPGMEFVLTYYDEPAVGGMPSTVTSWATGRAAPAFIERMRKAATDYTRWRAKNHQQEPDFTPFGPEKVSYEDYKTIFPFNEQDMESSKLGPDLEPETREQATQTEIPPAPSPAVAEPAVLIRVYPEREIRVDTNEETSNITVTKDVSTPSSASPSAAVSTKETEISQKPTEDSPQKTEDKSGDKSEKRSDESSVDEGPEQEASSRWWRYLHPYYYFV